MYLSMPGKRTSCRLLPAGFIVLELPIIATLAVGTLLTWLLLRAARAVESATHNLHGRTANEIRLRLRPTFLRKRFGAGPHTPRP